MSISRLHPLATFLVPALLLAGCSSDSKRGGGALYVESCSLGCTNGVDGAQVFCSVVNTFQNQEIALIFSEPVDLSSVNASSFRVVNVGNGTSPVGTFVVDSSNARKLVFRPDLTFDALGNPEFGLLPDTAYQITLPGVAQGDSPPFIASTSGRPNQSRLECTILTDQGIVDPVPGPPTVFARVISEDDFPCDENTTSEQLLAEIENLGVPADGSVNVCTKSPIVFTFQDVMNIATLLNPSTRESTFITVKVDADGQLGTSDDRVPVAGEYFYSLDLAALTTTLVFTPNEGYPSAGANDRRIVIEIPEGVIDLAGNGVTEGGGGGFLSFIPESVLFDPVVITEDFADSTQLDVGQSGANTWEPNRVFRGLFGGSGRLGELSVSNGQRIELNTDSQEFPLTNEPLDVVGNMDIGGVFPSTTTVLNGIFEFSSITIETGGILAFTGSNPPRLLSRGPVNIESGALIDLRGSSASAHDGSVAKPSENAGEVRGLGGPNAADGGWGGDRWNASGLSLSALRDVGAIENPGAVTDGQDANGVGNDPAGRTAGQGGRRYPDAFPTDADDLNASGDIAWENDELIDFDCKVRMVGNAGAGGGYSLVTDSAQTSTTPELTEEPVIVPNADNPTLGAGFVERLQLEPPDINNAGYDIRTLNPNSGSGALIYPFNLRGGSGGGGGGMHPRGSTSSLSLFDDCTGGGASWQMWFDHSGAAGGGGGGAIQIGSDSEVSVQGRIDASGGDGGSSLNPGLAEPMISTDFASPGGGGSGGAVLIQAPVVDIADVTSIPRIDVSGGTAGVAQGVEMIVSGSDGSPGLIRIQDGSARTNLEMNLELSPRLGPFDDGTIDGDFDADGDYVGPGNSVNWLSCDAGGLVESQTRPETLSGTVTCWFFVPGNYFSLNFDEDAGPNPEDKGWNVDIYYQGTTQADLIPFRGDNGGLFGGNDFETEFGNEINVAEDVVNGVSPIAVRFQGARLTNAPTDACNQALDGANVVFGSLTPWVDHPAKLNDSFIQPNAVRVAFIFDHAPEVGAVADDVRGVTNLILKAKPD